MAPSFKHGLRESRDLRQNHHKRRHPHRNGSCISFRRRLREEDAHAWRGGGQRRRAVYSSHTAKYEYFIGGELLAEYDPDSRVLVITGHGPAEGVVCKYTAEGALFVDPLNPAGINADVSVCNVLVSQLYLHMQR